MESITKVLQQAYQIVEEVRQPLAPETAAIRGIFLSIEKIKRYNNTDLYLEYIRTLLTERYNISFPEDLPIYERFFEDSIALKDLMTVNEQNKSDYFNHIKNMFAQMKTPYYEIYFKVLCAFERCFDNKQVLKKTLQDFYSIMIKSSPGKCELMGILSEQAPVYKEKGLKNETLISEILIHHLGLFCLEKNYWLTADLSFGILTDSVPANQVQERNILKHFLGKEREYLDSIGQDQIELAQPKSLSEFLAKENVFLYNEAAAHIQADSEEATTIIEAQDVSSEFLNTYAYNMNAVHYITNPAICREQELLDLELILISPKKSPILIGDAGTGKTSIVEGLAYRLQRNDVPDLLKGKKLFKLTTTSLLSGTKYVGEMEERMKKLTDELSRHPEVILFIDEIHTIVGAGSTESSNNDISNMLKPFIDRGDIKIIGATTRLEYEAYMMPDRALARRFYPIAIDEPDAETTLQILYGTIPTIEHETRVLNPYDEDTTKKILRGLIKISAPENQPVGQRTHRPELPLTLLEMAFSFAALSSREYLSKEDLEMSVLHSNLLDRACAKELCEKILDTIFCQS